MIERINKILSSYNFSASQFANEIGIQRSAMSHILSGRNKPSLDFVIKLLHRFPEINTDWLIFGKGPMTKLEAGESLALVDSKDLFTEDNTDKNPEDDNDLEDMTESNVEKKSPEKNIPEDNSIEKIVFFYKNGKFKDYSP